MSNSLPEAGRTATLVPVQTGLAPAHADLIQSVTRLDRAIKDRRESDQTLVKWWLYFLLHSWVMFGIYALYLSLKRISRLDSFGRMKQMRSFTLRRALAFVFLAALSATVLAVIAPSAALAAPSTFSYTGGVQNYVVPAGVNALQVSATGGNGGNGSYAGGAAGVINSTIPVTPGQTLSVYVGGNGAGGAGAAGGFNGGGNASGLTGGASGGGASDIRTSSSLSTRLIVAGGGGGGGYGYSGFAGGGSAGYPSGATGAGSNSNGNAGIGGGQFAGGLGGRAPGIAPGANGALGQGGQAGDYFYPPARGAGGGGGGYYGAGGGGAFAAGGGGSDYAAPGAEATTYSTSSAGTPQVIITPVSSDISIDHAAQLYGPTAVGASAPAASFTVTNNSLVPTTITAIGISGPDNASFPMTNNGCTVATVLVAGASCSLDVGFAPTATATKYAELDVVSSAGQYGANLIGNPPGATATNPNPLHFGQVTEGGSQTASVTVTNTQSNSLLHPTAASIGSDANAEFSIVTDGCAGQALASGQSCTIAVKFTPTTAGSAETALLNIPNDDPSQFGNTSVALQGQGLAAAIITASPNPVAFGQVTEGQAGSHKVTVTNSGVVALTPGASTISAGASAEFSISADACNGASLSQGQSCTITVRFAPSTHDTPETASLNIPNNDPTQNGSTAVSLQGAGQSPATLSAAPSPVDFGSAPEQSTTAQDVTVTNTGDLPLNLTASSLLGANVNQFAISNDACNGATLSQGQTCTITVQFAPTQRGSQTASLSIPSNDSNSPATVTVTGTGLAAADIAATPQSEAFGTIGVGQQSDVKTVTVTNTADQSLNIGQLALAGTNPGQFAIVAGQDACSSQSLGAGASCTVQVRFAPSVAGGLSATLSIASNAASGSPTGVPLSGSGSAAPTPPKAPTPPRSAPRLIERLAAVGTPNAHQFFTRGEKVRVHCNRACSVKVQFMVYDRAVTRGKHYRTLLHAMLVLPWQRVTVAHVVVRMRRAGYRTVYIKVSPPAKRVLSYAGSILLGIYATPAGAQRPVHKRWVTVPGPEMNARVAQRRHDS